MQNNHCEEIQRKNSNYTHICVCVCVCASWNCCCKEEEAPATNLLHTCTVPGCIFVGQTEAGLVNHTEQRHGMASQYAIHVLTEAAVIVQTLFVEVCSANKVCTITATSATETCHNNQTQAPAYFNIKVACIALCVKSRGGGGVCVLAHHS